MAINFCSERLGSVDTAELCSDGHDISNLVSVDSKRRQSGFIGDGYCRPPIRRNVRFVCPVTIHRLVLNCVNGRHKSNSLEVFAENQRGESYFVFKCDLEEYEEGLVFYRRGKRYRDPNIPKFPHRLCEFDGNSLLRGVIKLKILICDAQGSKVPALGGIDVWGVVAKSVSWNAYKYVINVWRSNEEAMNPKKVVELEKKYPEVPKEFFDEMTGKLLAIPFRVPSGHFIDFETLRQYYFEELALGRGMSDPFTREPFSSTKHPVYLPELKVRILTFLMKYPDHPRFREIPRVTPPPGELLRLEDYNPYLPKCTYFPHFATDIEATYDV